MTAAAGRAIFVVGMHRSGTSCLAGCLEERGLPLGNVIRSAPHNRKGNNENQRIMNLQDDLLAHNRGDWEQPPLRIVWADEHRSRRDAILGEYAGLPMFGIKDPRTLFTLDFWREVIVDLTLVATWRHPLSVAESLRARNGFTWERSARLWCTYNQQLLRYLREQRFDLVNFDLEPAEYSAKVSEVANRLGLAPPEGSLDFYDSALKHHAPPPDAELEGEVAEIFHELTDLSI